jgi:hypothetical protein
MIKIIKIIKKIIEKLLSIIFPSRQEVLSARSYRLVYGCNTFDTIVAAPVREAGEFDNYLKIQYEKIHDEMKKLPHNKRLFNGSMALTYKKELAIIAKNYDINNWFDFGAGNSAESVMKLSREIGVDSYHWHDLGVANHSQEKYLKYDLGNL